ncbi:anti-repressor SinI family protein [Salibacterium sp. K-3]
MRNVRKEHAGTYVDPEWEQLIKHARAQGLTKEEIRKYFHGTSGGNTKDNVGLMAFQTQRRGI